MRPDGRRHTLKDLYREDTSFDFMHRMWRWALISGIALAIGLGALLINGLNLGIDFTGGTAWQVSVADGQDRSVNGVRDALRPLGQADAKIQEVGDSDVRVQTEDLSRAEQREVTEALAEYAGVEPADVSVSRVSGTWGSTVTEQAVRALVIMFIIIGAYLSFRFEWKMAVAALLAVVHDILITVGIYAVTGFEVTPATVIAVLTILGFSLYDTVVVFDKVKENQPLLGTSKGETYSDMVNRSLNQVLMRSLNTSLVALLPIISLLLVGSVGFGAVSLLDFGLALFVGILAGAYSSIFVATPLLAIMKEREPRNRALRERAEVHQARERDVAAPDGDDARTEERAPVAAGAPTRTAPAPVITPRPRQQRGKKRR